MVKTVSFAALAWVCAATSVMAAEHVIMQKNKAFSAANLSIQPGDSIVFKNDDDVTHNVFSNSTGFQFNLKMQAPGTSAGYTFKEAGKAEVRCVIHPQMKLMVDVNK
jgi:plastocyanin